MQRRVDVVLKLWCEVRAAGDHVVKIRDRKHFWVRLTSSPAHVPGVTRRQGKPSRIAEDRVEVCLVGNGYVMEE
jgi:hypothetical protein